MIVTIPCRFAESKNGVALKSYGLGLTGFGRSRDDAIRDVEHGALAWCRALDRQGILSDALSRAGLRSEADDTTDITVRVVISDVQ